MFGNKWQIAMKEGVAIALHNPRINFRCGEYMSLVVSINNGLEETDKQVGHQPITDTQRTDTKIYFETMLK